MLLSIGDFAPWSIVPSTAHSQHHVDLVSGHRTVLFFFGSASSPEVRAVLERFLGSAKLWRSQGITVLGVSIDPRDQVLETLPLNDSCAILWDFDGTLSQQYGVCQLDSAQGEGITYDPTTLVLDENLRVLGIFPLDRQIDLVAQVTALLEQLSPVSPPMQVSHQAPVLLIPNVFEPDFCQSLLDFYHADGGQDSGFMQRMGDKTVEMLDPAVKQRRDLRITNPNVIGQINQRIWRRVKPEVEKAFHFNITNFERYLVGCYDAKTAGFFKPHRDNNSPGTVHRRFAMTLNLNAGYEGGYLRFPEYGPLLYRPAPGAAAIFSCSLLHEATPVTQGQRFALLSFFYNEEDAKVREQNKASVILKPTHASPAAANRSPSGFQAKSKRKT
jgi:peroxiredoxin/predicted 2-oxoglutarate/Fe(II)-dependent dioxygenase YbiX